DDYDPRLGWTEKELRSRRPHPPFSCSDAGCLQVRMAVGSGGEPLTIPVPTGFRLDPNSLRWNGQHPGPVWLDDAGAASVELDPGDLGMLSYTIGPAREESKPRVDYPTGARLKGRVVRWLEARRRSTDRVSEVTSWVQNTIDYDVSQRAARRFERQPGDWIDRVMATRAGDCDVKNGVNVLYLRHLGIPARLAVGMVSIGGRARSGLHAWTEYYDDGQWRVADATGQPRDSLPVSGRDRISVGSASAPGVARPMVVAPTGVTEVELTPPSATPRPRSPASVPIVPPTPAESQLPTEARARQELSVETLPTRGRPESSVRPDSDRTDTSEPKVSGPENYRWLAWALIALGGLGILAVSVAYRRRRIVERLERRGEGADQRAAVAGMVRELLRGNAGWRGVSALGHRRVLPTLEGRPMSLVEAMDRSRKGTLWAGDRRSLLARSAATKGNPVIDLDDYHFGALVRQTFDIVDLSALEALNVTRLPSALSRVLNPIFEKHARITCVWSGALGDSGLTEYDLTSLGITDNLELPPRAIVINPEHPEVRALIATLEQNPTRATYLWVDWIVSHSMACEPYASRLREAGAATVFEDAVA
ncbi:MAG: transglutaminase domain-containing protein, partial [Myxococcota bacterium]